MLCASPPWEITERVNAIHSHSLRVVSIGDQRCPGNGRRQFTQGWRRTDSNPHNARVMIKRQSFQLRANRHAGELVVIGNIRRNRDVCSFSRSSSSGSNTTSNSSSCEQSYGVFPCTDNIIGNFFMLAVYGYLLFVASKLQSEGSASYLAVLKTGSPVLSILGALLPILGALPGSILILVSGLGGTRAEAQEQVLVGIGLLSGSTVLLLTLLWGICLILGCCDLEDVNGKYTAIDKKLTRPFSLKDTGVENDDLTRLSAGIMTVSVFPYIVAQLPRIFHFSDGGNVAVLVACVLSLGGLAAYFLCQVFTPLIQQRWKEIAERKFNKLLAVTKIMKRSGVEMKLVDNMGKLDSDYARMLFEHVDVNKDKSISYNELQTMLPVRLAHRLESSDMAEHFMKEFDKNKDGSISEGEFLDGMQKLCGELKLKPEHSLLKLIKDAENDCGELNQAEEDDDDDDEEAKSSPSKAQIIKKAVLFLVVGTVVATVFADPLVDAVSDFSDASHIPPFFISFVLLPLASNSSEVVSSTWFSARKTKRNMSLNYSQIYGAVTFNNTIGLGMFLAVVYGRQLAWDFSSEVLVTVIVTVVMGVLGSFRKVFPLWVAGVSLLLYPLSLGLVAISDYVAGWQ